MTAVLSAFAPVYGLIVVGYLLKARGVFTDAFWDQAERLTFYFLFPALRVTSIGDTGGRPGWRRRCGAGWRAGDSGVSPGKKNGVRGCPPETNDGRSPDRD